MRPLADNLERVKTYRHQGMAALALLAATLLFAACADSATDSDGALAIPGGATPVDDPFSGGYPTYDDEATGLRIVFGTPDLGVGASRVSLALFDDVGVVSAPTITAATRYYPDGPGGEPEDVEDTELRFFPFPEGGRGIYVGTLNLDRAGLWAVALAVPRSDGSTAQVVIPVTVADETVAPAVGAAAAASDSRTLADVAEASDLTTASEPDPRLYATSIASALEQGMPFVVTFASPAFCTNALCGPQVDVLSELADAHDSRALFIHVDLYENPRELQGDFSLARRTSVLDEWGIHTDEWTFVVDATGTVTARFEGFAPREEVEAALLAALEG